MSPSTCSVPFIWVRQERVKLVTLIRSDLPAEAELATLATQSAKVSPGAGRKGAETPAGAAQPKP